MNFVGGFTNAFISEINGGMWTSGGGMAYMHISGNPVPQIATIPIWGDYDTFKYSSWIGSTVGVTASFVLVGEGIAALSGRALATTSKATTKAADNTRKFGQNGTRATDTGAQSVVSGTKLSLRLASEQQLGEAGTPIIGAGTDRALLPQTTSRLTSQYGGVADDWAKMTSSTYTARNGFTIETHWYQNVSNGLRVEPKTTFRWQTTGAG